MKYDTAKHFVLQLGSLITLYLSLGFLISLLFGLINVHYPDATDGYYLIESTSYNIRLAIAMLVVFFPTYIVLTRFVNKLRRTETSSEFLPLTKWLIYLSLLVGALVLLSDLVTVLLTFLNGEITERFIFKALSVLIVVGLALHYYILDVRGFWIKHESRSVMFGYGALIAVFVAVAFGFGNIETPSQVREMKLDAQQITDLQTIQWRVQDAIIEASSTVPTTLDDVFTEFPAPTAPENREAYSYAKTDKGFELCATFAQASIPNEFEGASPMMGDKTMPIVNPDNWQHKAGHYCFQRIVR